MSGQSSDSCCGQRPSEHVSPANFRIVETPVPAPGSRTGAGQAQVSVARPLHARPAERREVLRQTPGGGRGHAGRDGRRRRGVRQPALQARRRRCRHGRLAALRAQRRSRPAGGRRQGDPDLRPISAPSACLASPPGTGSTRSSHPRRGRRCSSRPRPGPSAPSSASLRERPVHARSASPEGRRNAHYAVDELGYAACVDHKSPEFAAQLKAALPGRRRRAVRERRRRAVPTSAAGASTISPALRSAA